MTDEIQNDDPETQRIADDLIKVEKARVAVRKAQGPESLEDRAQYSAAVRKAEAEYLERVGGNAAPWRTAAREAGRIE